VIVCVSVAWFAVSLVNAAVRDDDVASLLCALQLPYLRLTDVISSSAAAYLSHLSHAQQRIGVCMFSFKCSYAGNCLQTRPIATDVAWSVYLLVTTV